MSDHSPITPVPGSIIERLQQQTAAKQRSAATVLADLPTTINMQAWYEQHSAILYQFLHHTIRAIASTPARRNRKVLRHLEQAHSDLKRHAALVVGNAIPVVQGEGGNNTIPFSRLAEAQAKVQVLTAELALARSEASRLKVEGWRPAFDVMSARQEELAIQFCQEIAGRRGEPGSPPDPVRLLEMAEALYEAERHDFCSMAGRRA